MVQLCVFLRTIEENMYVWSQFEGTKSLKPNDRQSHLVCYKRMDQA